MHTILIVEDSLEFQKIIQRTLNEFKTIIVSSAEDALNKLACEKIDLVIVDINLPQKDGYSLLSEIRSQVAFKDLPAMCLTGRNDITDKVTAFSLGADDYITKPFDPLEVRARVESKLKKISRKITADSVTTVGDIQIDHARHRVSINEGDIKSEVSITQTEFKILCCLARRPDQVFSRDQLLVAAWGEDASVLDRVVDAHVCMLRKKLGTYARYIKAVTGIGYKLNPAPLKKKAS